MNKKYSFKDFTGQSFAHLPAEEFNNSEIIGSCFSQEHKVRNIFPADMTGVHFRRCNLDNCFIPPGNVLKKDGWEKCSNRRFRVQNDGHDWIVDESGNPVEPCDKDVLMKFPEKLVERIIDPVKLPVKFIREEDMTKDAYNAYFVNGSDTHQWFKGVPEIIESTYTSHKVRGEAYLYAGQRSEEV